VGEIAPLRIDEIAIGDKFHPVHEIPEDWVIEM